MKLESIYVGKPVKVTFNNREVKTGIYKNLVSGSVKVEKMGLEGDQQADLTVHGGEDKAVYAYPVEHYGFWRKRRPDLNPIPGLFGENLATTGLDESVNVGDEFQIGTTRLQVTNPRMPCFKLGIRVGDAGFVREFMKEERNGFYLRVLEEGTIEAGDEITKIGEDGHGLTISELIQLYTTRKSDKELLQKTIASPTLPKDWVDHFEVVLHRLK